MRQAATSMPIPTLVRTGTAIYGWADMRDDSAYVPKNMKISYLLLFALARTTQAMYPGR